MVGRHVIGILHLLCCVYVYQGTPGGPRTVTLAVAAGAGAGEGGEEGSSESKPVPSLPVYDFGSGRHSDYDTKWEPFVAGNYLVSNCPGLSRLPPSCIPPSLPSPSISSLPLHPHSSPCSFLSVVSFMTLRLFLRLLIKRYLCPSPLLSAVHGTAVIGAEASVPLRFLQ